MLPGQQRAALAAARAAKEAEASGQPLARHHLDALRQFPEFSGEFLRKQDTANAMRNGIEEFKQLTGHTGRQAAADANVGAASKVVVEGRNQISVDMNTNASEAATELVDLLVPLLQTNMEAILAEVANQLKVNNDKIMRQQNGQGRQLAGG
jgi:hypothetical protein